MMPAPDLLVMPHIAVNVITEPVAEPFTCLMMLSGIAVHIANIINKWSCYTDLSSPDLPLRSGRKDSLGGVTYSQAVSSTLGAWRVRENITALWSPYFPRTTAAAPGAHHPLWFEGNLYNQRKTHQLITREVSAWPIW